MLKFERMPNIASKMMSLIHDNPLQWIFRNPYRILKAAGLKSGQKVLEVGCWERYMKLLTRKEGRNEYIS